MGIRIMKYRAGMIGGTLTIDQAAKGGLSVICTVHRSHRRLVADPS